MRRRYMLNVTQFYEVEVETDREKLLEDDVAMAFIDGGLWPNDFMAPGRGTERWILHGGKSFKDINGFDVMKADLVDERLDAGDGYGLYGVAVKV